MSIETEFESTIQNVQNAYQGLDNLGATIPQNKTIENIKNCLDEIYAKFPKTDYEEGSNITLSNTLKGKLDFENDIVGYGQTSQEGTPTPETPQEIEVVRGKNLLKPILNSGTASGITYTKNSDNSITLGGTSTGIFLVIIGYINAKKGTSYTISGGVSGNLQVQARVENQSGTTRMASDGSVNQSYTAEIDETLAIIIRIPNGVQISETTIYPMLEKGSQATSYLPYNTLEVVERGINLLDKTQVVGNNTATTVTQINTGFRVSAETLGYAGVTTIDVKANTNYFLKFNTNVIVDSGSQKYVRIFAGTTQTTTIATYTFTEGGGTFNTGNNTKINIWFYCSLGGSGTVDYTNVQLQEGSTATTYEPYITPTSYQLSLGDIELCGIGDYKDELIYDVDEDKVYKNEAIRKKVLNSGSDEDWAYETTYNRFALIETINDYNITLRTTAICNYYRYGDTSIDNYFALSSTGKLALFHAPTNISTLAEWKTWLSTNNLILYYILATAIKEEITGTLKDQIKALYNSHSFTGTTIIEIDGQLPLIIKVSALKGE